MPTRLVESLREKKVIVQMRTSDCLITKLVMIHLDSFSKDADLKNGPTVRAINIGVLSEDHAKTQAEEKANTVGKKNVERNDVEPKPLYIDILPVDEIYDVKARDYTERLTNFFTIQVIRENQKLKQEPMGFEQVMFIFESVDDRDTWKDGLTSLISHQKWNRYVPKPPTKLRFIKNIEELQPTPKDFIRFRVTVGEYEPVDFTVPKDAILTEEAEKKKATAELRRAAQRKPVETFGSNICKELVDDFVLANYIVPAEGVSLYRYVRALVSRLMMEYETIAITDEINQLRWDAKEVAKSHTADIRVKVDADDKKLRDLGRSLRDRIGRHGPAAPLVIKILQRSIDKTLHFNRNHCHAMLGNIGEAINDDS